ncbi:MAG TPA: DUF971 domain-containing protein [Gammaproteobacteria bacterium]
MSTEHHLPVEIKLHRQQRLLEISYEDGNRFELPCEYLRVYSPSAEVQGHHNEGAVLQVGKEDVNITDLQQVGQYALKIFFDDNHKSGLFTWAYLYELGKNQEAHWADYLRRLDEAGHKRRA